MIRSLVCLALLVIASSSLAAEPAPPIRPVVAQPPGTPVSPTATPPVFVQPDTTTADQAAREAAFAKLMSGATLEGQFTARDRADGKAANDKYTLGKVSSEEKSFLLRLEKSITPAYLSFIHKESWY